MRVLKSQAQMEAGVSIASPPELVEQLPSEPDNLEDFDLITNEDFEALARIFSHSPCLEQILEEANLSSSTLWDETLDGSSVDFMNTKTGPEDVSMVQQNEVDEIQNTIGILNNSDIIQVTELGQNLGWNNPIEHHTFTDPNGQVWKDVNCNDIEKGVADCETKNELKNCETEKGFSSNSFSEVFILKSAEAFGKSPRKTQLAPVSRKKVFSERKTPNKVQIPPQSHNQCTHRSLQSEEKKHVLTFSFSEEYPKFPKEISLPRKPNGDTSNLAAPGRSVKGRKQPGLKNMEDTTCCNCKPKQAFVFGFPKGPSKIHEWHCQQKKLVDEAEEKNGNKNFFKILLPLRDGSKIICERNNKLFLERQKILPQVEFLNNQRPETKSLKVEASSSKTSVPIVKKVPTARKSCSKGSAQLLRKNKDQEKVGKNEFTPKARRNVLENWTKFWSSRKNSHRQTSGRSRAGNDTDEQMVELTRPPDFSDLETESENNCEESVVCESEEPPLVIISDDDDVLMSDSNLEDSFKHQIITLS